ncbi:5'-3' exonuclease H3TH domain-containing protein [Mycoplasma sp. ATU-Cv-703]|uniref:5'-3' exonuclease H3TH domain-containing protein n=1 Tax=Mycoplasma sp. ATU-Cv-703 TaxID=2498595 RepID=UPI001374E1DA
MINNKKMVLVDGNSLFFRAYYGTMTPGREILTNSSDLPVNALLTFGRMMINLVFTHQPDYLFVAFDTGKKTKRHQMCERYKSNRTKAPEALQLQFPIMYEMLDSLKIKHYALEGYEADDLIASIVNKYQNKLTMTVFSGDRDLWQLVSPGVSLIAPQSGRKKPIVLDLENFRQHTGLVPEQIVDYKSLVGDSSDNLPGITGIGPKTALKLLQEYQSLEKIYDHLPDLPPGVAKKLVKDQKQAFLTRQLVKLENQLQVPFELDELKYESKNVFFGIKFFQKYELFSLVNKLKAEIDPV